MKGKQCDSCELKHWGITSGKAKNLGFLSQAARVHLSFRAGSTFPLPYLAVWTLYFIKVKFTFTKGAEVRVMPVKGQ